MKRRAGKLQKKNKERERESEKKATRKRGIAHRPS